MIDEKDKSVNKNSSADNNDEQETINVQNPFNKDDDKKLTEEDVENEQTFKEAQTERD